MPLFNVHSGTKRCFIAVINGTRRGRRPSALWKTPCPAHRSTSCASPAPSPSTRLFFDRRIFSLSTTAGESKDDGGDESKETDSETDDDEKCNPDESTHNETLQGKSVIRRNKRSNFQVCCWGHYHGNRNFPQITVVLSIMVNFRLEMNPSLCFFSLGSSPNKSWPHKYASNCWRSMLIGWIQLMRITRLVYEFVSPQLDTCKSEVLWIIAFSLVFFNFVIQLLGIMNIQWGDHSRFFFFLLLNCMQMKIRQRHVVRFFLLCK